LSGEGPGKGWVTWYKISLNLGDFYHVTFTEAQNKMAAEEEFEIYLRMWKRCVRGSDGFIERQHVIFAGFLEAGRLIKEPGVLWYVKFMKIVSRNRNVSCLFLLLHG